MFLEFVILVSCRKLWTFFCKADEKYHLRQSNMNTRSRFRNIIIGILLMKPEKQNVSLYISLWLNTNISSCSETKASFHLSLHKQATKKLLRFLVAVSGGVGLPLVAAVGEVSPYARVGGPTLGWGHRTQVGWKQRTRGTGMRKERLDYKYRLSNFDIICCRYTWRPMVADWAGGLPSLGSSLQLINEVFEPWKCIVCFNKNFLRN